MRTERTSAKALTLFIAIITAWLLMPFMAAAGQLQPTAPPGPTMKTLDEIPPTWSQKLPAAQRFELVLDGEAVLDKETGLVWERSPNTTPMAWSQAYSFCYAQSVAGRKGWRMPTVFELASLVDPTQTNPALPSGHPFVNVQSNIYWTITEYAGSPNYVWLVGMYYGDVGDTLKTNTHYVWAVRGGQ